MRTSPQWIMLNKAFVAGSLDMLDEESLHLVMESDRDFRVSLLVELPLGGCDLKNQDFVTSVLQLSSNY